jgi:hypothetical protein
LGPLPSTACSTTQAHPLPIPSPSNWSRLPTSQTLAASFV